MHLPHVASVCSCAGGRTPFLSFEPSGVENNMSVRDRNPIPKNDDRLSRRMKQGHYFNNGSKSST